MKAGLTSVSDFSRSDFIFADQMASRSTAVQQVLNKTNRRVPLYSLFTVNNTKCTNFKSKMCSQLESQGFSTNELEEDFLTDVVFFK